MFAWLAFALTFGLAIAHAGDDRSAILWQEAMDIASGKGEKGPWRQNDSHYDYVDDPTVAIDAQGNIAVAWVDQKQKDVQFRRILRKDGKQGTQKGAKASTQAVNVSRSPDTFSWLPRILFAPNDQKTIYLIWQEIIFSGASHGGEIFFARSEDGGQSFAPPVNVSHSFGGDGKGRINKDVWHNGSYDLAVGRDGTLYVVWTEYDGMLWIAYSSDGGTHFSEPRHIAGSQQRPARGPSVAVGKAGEVYLAWTTGENDRADILFSRSEGKGSLFSAPQAVAASPGYSDAPKLAVDGKGGLHLAYAESDGNAFGNYHVRYVRFFDEGRSYEAPRDVSSASSEVRAGAAFPSLVVDANDTVVLTWERFTVKRERPRGLGIAVSIDGGSTFTSPEIVPDSVDASGGANGSHQGLLMEKLALNASGTLAVVNSSMKPDARSRIWLMRGRLER